MHLTKSTFTWVCDLCRVHSASSADATGARPEGWSRMTPPAYPPGREDTIDLCGVCTQKIEDTIEMLAARKVTAP